MSKSDNILEVSTLLSLYANSLSSTIDGKLIEVEAFFSDNNNKLYGQYYYDEIVSKEKQHKITIQITEGIKSKIVSGSYYNFQGYMCRGRSLDNDSRLKVFFRVAKILEHKEEVQHFSKVEYDIIRARFDREFPIIQDILLSKIEREIKPNLDIIIGVQSTSHDDYINQLKDKHLYNIRHHNCNLSTKVEMVKFLEDYNFEDSDLLIILRGGGSGLEVFNDIELCKLFIDLKTPFITGIGHDKDKTLLQRISDMGFSTPTAVGIFLQKIVNKYKDRIKLVSNKDLEMEHYKKVVESEKMLLNNQIMTQKNNFKIIWIALVLLLLGIAYLSYLVINK